MPQKRPRSVTVIAIMNFVFGVLGICCAGAYLFTGVGLILIKTAQQPQQFLAMPGPEKGRPGEGQAVPYTEEQQVSRADYVFYLVAEGGLGLVLSLMMIASYFGLLGVKSWGRSLSIVYGFVSMIANLAGLIYGVVFILPAGDAVGRVQDVAVLVRRCLGGHPLLDDGLCDNRPLHHVPSRGRGRIPGTTDAAACLGLRRALSASWD